MQFPSIRYHNKLADDLARVNPQWSDERLFQEARRILSAVMQVLYKNVEFMINLL